MTQEENKTQAQVASAKTVEATSSPVQSDLKVRTKTAVIYTVVCIACIALSKYTTALLLMVASYATCREFAQLENKRGHALNERFLALIAAALPVMEVLNFIPNYWGAISVILALMIFQGFELMTKKITPTDYGRSIFVVTYTGLLPLGLLYVRANAIGDGIVPIILALLVFFSPNIADVFAYLIGCKFGKHKIAPKISPKKSWEGFFGGLFGATLLWGLITLIPSITFSLWAALLCGLFCGICAFFGDLYESHIKRAAGVKDSGTALPGHGGFFDRLDSVIAVAPVAYIFLVLGGAVSFL